MITATANLVQGPNWLGLLYQGPSALLERYDIIVSLAEGEGLKVSSEELQKDRFDIAVETLGNKLFVGDDLFTTRGKTFVDYHHAAKTLANKMHHAKAVSLNLIGDLGKMLAGIDPQRYANAVTQTRFSLAQDSRTAPVDFSLDAERVGRTDVDIDPAISKNRSYPTLVVQMISLFRLLDAARDKGSSQFEIGVKESMVNIPWALHGATALFASDGKSQKLAEAAVTLSVELYNAGLEKEEFERHLASLAQEHPSLFSRGAVRLLEEAERRLDPQRSALEQKFGIIVESAVTFLRDRRPDLFESES